MAPLRNLDAPAAAAACIQVPSIGARRSAAEDRVETADGASFHNATHVTETPAPASANVRAATTETHCARRLCTKLRELAQGPLRVTGVVCSALAGVARAGCMVGRSAARSFAEQWARVRRGRRSAAAYLASAASVSAATWSMSRALSAVNGLFMSTRSTILASPTETTKAPLRGLSALTETVALPFSAATSFAARVLNAPQDLHASIWTAGRPPSDSSASASASTSTMAAFCVFFFTSPCAAALRFGAIAANGACGLGAVDLEETPTRDESTRAS
eukprot:CAMPEP_0184203308 /NCGR_PEP_ID=MMETSP0976-20121227/8990_1 /TAXON_ID=483370 /ORGANISM="non described non described, Strain CCMP2097" /LENGTH=275 /DNA_ID=CAMNT_0026507863 /DNA_START=27 /DNA_END=852 /DNA_ORIENTATION=+